jgi:hypothetical protein
VSEPIRMTDKKETKILPCGVCQVPLLVTKFLQPEKARCPQHSGKVSSADRALIQVTVAESKDATPNRALAGLRCPICDSPIKLLGTEKGGFLAFRCLNSPCNCAIEIKPNWGALMMNKISPEWQDFADQFNSLQKEQMLYESSHIPVQPIANVVPPEGDSAEAPRQGDGGW